MKKGHTLDIQPEDFEPIIAVWFEDWAFDDNESRNKEMSEFVKFTKKEIKVDLSNLYQKHVVKKRSEDKFFNEAEKVIVKAGYCVYQSDNFFEVFDDLTEEEIERCNEE